MKKLPLHLGFPPLEKPDSRILVLGSMPGQASLDQQAYYAHPQNKFWTIWGALLGFAPADPYAARCGALVAAGVALWDVARACRRTGSLDSAIVPDSIQLNDFTAFFRDHPQIKAVFFNGRMAEKTFQRLVLPDCPAAQSMMARILLPSTSPAYAGMTYAEKLKSWRRVLPYLTKEE